MNFYSTPVSTRMNSALVVLLLVFGGCSDPRVALIESFEPSEGMELQSVEDALGIPDFTEMIEGELDESLLTQKNEIRVGYGPFRIQTETGKHETKYRLNLVFEIEYKLELDSEGSPISLTIDKIMELKKLGVAFIPKLREWHRESPK